jgi:hypothetical protein
VTRGLALAVVALAACAPAAADDPPFEVRIAAEQTIELGTTAAISVAVVPGAGRSISQDGPIRLGAEAADDALTLPRRRFARRDAADPAADAPRFDVRVKARQPGDHTVAIDLRFWLCRVKTCTPIALHRDVVVHVPAPPIDAGVDAPIDAAPPIDAGRARRNVK